MFIFKLRVGLMYLQNIKSYLHDLDFYTGIHFYKRFLMIGEGVQHIHHAKYWRTFYNFHILFKSGYNYHDFEILNPSCLRTLFEMFFLYPIFFIFIFYINAYNKIFILTSNKSVNQCVVITVFQEQYMILFFSKYGIEIHTVHFNIYAI